MGSISWKSKGLYNVNTLGGSQKNWFLTEDGIYEVLMQSRKPIVILLLNNLIRYYYSNTRVDLSLYIESPIVFFSVLGNTIIVNLGSKEVT